MTSLDPATTIYYLPGRGAKLHSGLGKALLDRGWHVTGRALEGEFLRMPFGDQVDTVAQDLKALFWHPQARVVANSFGAYLFLHAQAQMEAFPGRVLLLSPIIGSSELSHGRAQLFSPPRSELLMELAKAGRLSKPKHCEIHVGDEDWQSVAAYVAVFAEHTKIPIAIIPGHGHDLERGYLSSLLDRWA